MSKHNRSQTLPSVDALSREAADARQEAPLLGDTVVAGTDPAFASDAIVRKGELLGAAPGIDLGAFEDAEAERLERIRTSPVVSDRPAVRPFEEIQARNLPPEMRKIQRETLERIRREPRPIEVVRARGEAPSPGLRLDAAPGELPIARGAEGTYADSEAPGTEVDPSRASVVVVP